jgi:hypothetical protein
MRASAKVTISLGRALEKSYDGRALEHLLGASVFPMVSRAGLESVRLSSSKEGLHIQREYTTSYI